jgi:prepilin-type N-terminal cleavage/methylation domain-containing protein
MKTTLPTIDRREINVQKFARQHATATGHRDAVQAGRIAPRRGGFTLVELLVVISIIILLLGIALPTLQKVRQGVAVAASRTTIRLIETGCKSYFADLGDYPPSETKYKDAGTWDGKNYLVQAMLGYFPDTDLDGIPYGDSQELDGVTVGDDGKEGFGFRIIFRGDVYGPYLDEKKAKLGRSGNGKLVFLDEFDNEIEYYRFDPEDKTYGGSDINNYAKDNDGEFFRRDFILRSKGPTGSDWEAYRDHPDTDDITNFLQ